MGVLVTTMEVVDESNDAGQLVPMVQQKQDVLEVSGQMTPANFGCYPCKDVSDFRRKGQPVVMLNLACPANHPYRRGVSTQDLRARFDSIGEAAQAAEVLFPFGE